MTHTALALGLVMGLSAVGLGLDVAHPAFFSFEPLVLWTTPGEGSPTVIWGGAPWPVAWQRRVEGDRIRWEGTFPAGSPLGVWIVCAVEGCHAFLRVSEEEGILDIAAAPGAVLVLDGQARVADAAGRAFFVAPPGDHVLVVTARDERMIRSVRTQGGQRTRLTLALATAHLSAGVALPGHTVTLSVHVVPPRDLPTLAFDLALPEGWGASADPDLLDPLPAGATAIRSWRVSIPAEASLGEYLLTIELSDLGVEARATLLVTDRLPARVVVCHWDMAADALDLALPCAITYDRLLWAATFVGRELPFTGRPLARSELEALAAEWEEGP